MTLAGNITEGGGEQGGGGSRGGGAGGIWIWVVVSVPLRVGGWGGAAG